MKNGTKSLLQTKTLLEFELILIIFATTKLSDMRSVQKIREFHK